jgi:hypothetical protein
MYLPEHKFYWGHNSWIQNTPIEAQSLFFKCLHLLSFTEVAPYYGLVIVLQIFFCLSAVTGPFPKISSLVVWYLTTILYNKVYITLDGGNNIISLMLLYAILMDPSESRTEGRGNFLKIYISNWALLISRVQLCIVYFVAGHLKMTGTHWANGTAFYYTFNVDEFTTPILQYLFSHFSPLTVIFSYTTILFQISFAFLIWFKETRPLLFLMGTAMHLGIAFGMGLVSFGLAMTICYSLFFTEVELNRILNLKNFLQRMKVQISL